jgi:CRP-like cAMP-binding protein
MTSEPADTSDRIALLRHVRLFAGLSEEDLEAIAEVSVSRRYQAGEVVFREGDGGDTCYIVRSGLARAVRQHSDGRSITLSHFGPGDIFGELAMFDEEPRSATVDVIDALEAMAIPGRDMQRLMREYPEIAVKLNTALAQRLRATNERLARQSFQTVQSPDPGRPGKVGWLLAGVGKPLPGVAGALGSDNAGTWPPDGA